MSALADLKTRARGPEFLAKLDGPCKGCPEPIVKGEHYICIVDGVGPMHGTCAADYCRVLEEHLEDE